MKATLSLLAAAYRHDLSAMAVVDALLHGGPRPADDPRLAACEQERADDPEGWAAAVDAFEDATYGS